MIDQAEITGNPGQDPARRGRQRMGGSANRHVLQDASARASRYRYTVGLGVLRGVLRGRETVAPAAMFAARQVTSLRGSVPWTR